MLEHTMFYKTITSRSTNCLLCIKSAASNPVCHPIQNAIEHNVFTFTALSSPWNRQQINRAAQEAFLCPFWVPRTRARRHRSSFVRNRYDNIEVKICLRDLKSGNRRVVSSIFKAELPWRWQTWRPPGRYFPVLWLADEITSLKHWVIEGRWRGGEVYNKTHLSVSPASPHITFILNYYFDIRAFEGRGVQKR